MRNWYTNRTLLKAAMGIPVSTTGDHATLDDVLETVSRTIDTYLGFHCYPSSGVRDYTARHNDDLYLDAPLTAVDAIQLDPGGDSTYETTMAVTDYYAKPYNATMESPARPWWEIETRPNATTVFPEGITRGVRVKGTWGYFNQTRSTTAVLSATVTTGAITLELTGATSIQPGDTILIGSERMFVERSPVSATGAHTSTIQVQRAVNGTSGFAHASGAAVSVYEYPVISRATLYQAELDYRVKDAPSGFAGGESFSQPVGGGLHPFVRRTLDSFRVPVVI